MFSCFSSLSLFDFEDNSLRFLKMMDPEELLGQGFLQIKAVLRNFKDYPDLIILEQDREIVIQRRNVLSKKIRYECSGFDHERRSCRVLYDVTLDPKIWKRTAYQRRRVRNGKEVLSIDYKTTVYRNEDKFNTSNCTCRRIEGSHTCCHHDNKRSKIPKSLKQFLSDNSQR